MPQKSRPAPPAVKPTITKRALIPVYRSHFALIIANSIQETLPAQTKFHGCYIAPPAQYCRARAFMDTEGYYSVALVRGEISHRAIAHEALHVVAGLMNFHGVQYDPANHEAFAYVNDWIVERIYAMLASQGEAVASTLRLAAPPPAGSPPASPNGRSRKRP